MKNEMRAYPLNLGQVATAQHAPSNSSIHASISIMSLAGGIHVSGVESLKNLQIAIAFALQGDKK